MEVRDYRKHQGQIPEHIPMDKKHPLQSKTVWGIIVLILGAIFTALGMPDANFEFLSDGLQMADLGAIMLTLGYILKEYGKRVAKTELTTFWGSSRAK